jgi:hypothetical protein
VDRYRTKMSGHLLFDKLTKQLPKYSNQFMVWRAAIWLSVWCHIVNRVLFQLSLARFCDCQTRVLQKINFIHQTQHQLWIMQNDSQTYTYLKRLEEMSRHQHPNIVSTQRSFGSFIQATLYN